MRTTREIIDESAAETRRALAMLSESQSRLARDRIVRELEDFIRNEWLPVRSEEREAVDRRKRVFAAFGVTTP